MNRVPRAWSPMAKLKQSYDSEVTVMPPTQKPAWNLEKLKELDGCDSFWKLFNYLGEQERHFNQLQAGYRVTASGWLLASLGAMGFVTISHSDTAMISILVCGIGAAGAVGIYLLWVVDILVYHRLLDACFVEGLKLERVVSGIPPTRHNMMRMLSSRGVLFRIVGYYLGPIVLLTLLSGGGLVIYLRAGHPTAALMAAVATSVVAFFASLLLYKETANSDEFLAQLENDSRGNERGPRRTTSLATTLSELVRAMPVVLLGLVTCGGVLVWLAEQEQPVAALAAGRLRPKPDYLAPDTSEVRLLTRGVSGSLAHFTLPQGQTSVAVSHKTVEEVWYFLGGRGEMWRRLGSHEEVVEVSSGTSINIPRSAAFQFRATGNEPLTAVAITIPPWPGADEAVPAIGRW